MTSLLWRIDIWPLVYDASILENCLTFSIEKFSAVIAANYLNRGVELIMDHCNKILISGWDLCFVRQKVCPCGASEIVHYGEYESCT